MGLSSSEWKGNTDDGDGSVVTVVTGHLRLDTKGIAVLGKLQSSSGSPFGVPFHPKYLKYAHQTVSLGGADECCSLLTIFPTSSQQRLLLR